MTFPADTPTPDAAVVADAGAAGADGQEALVPDDVRPSRDRWGLWVAGSIALPLLLYVVLRPENYSLTPNSLDPIFYTGYAFNFDDVLNAVGDRHYFVTRWTAYFPMYVLDQAFSPFLSRLFWRWCLAIAVVVAVAAVGRRHALSRAQQVLGAVVVLSMPIFVRAFMTDYVEYLVVALGVCLVSLCLRERQTVVSGSAIGLLTGCMIVANPVAIIFIGMSCVTALVLSSGWRSRLVLVLSSSVTAILVVAFGFVLFRWQYGIADVYAPSIRFMRTYQGDPDAWRSPRLDWAGRFLWIYLPLVVIVGGVAASLRRRDTWRRSEVAAVVLAVVMYAYQWYDQFVREGFSLEISFYWSFGYPTFGIALAVVIGKLTSGLSQRSILLLMCAWIALMAVGVAPWLRLPPGLLALVVIVVVVTLIVVSAVRAPVVAATVMLGLVAWMQIGTPTYTPVEKPYLNVSPNYAGVFWHAGSESDVVFDELVWFERNMDDVVNDASASFVTAGGWAPSIVGIYAPHVVGRWIVPRVDTGRIDEGNLREIRAGARPILAVYGDPREVERAVAGLDAELAVGEVLLDRTHDSALGYRLVVYRMPDSTRLPFVWSADALPLASGRREGSVAVSSRPDPPGFVTYGPYITLPAGRYEVTLTYRSSAPASEMVGQFDAAVFGNEVAGALSLQGTRGAIGQAMVSFDVSDPNVSWEFRTSRSGSSDLTIETITLARSSG